MSESEENPHDGGYYPIGLRADTFTQKIIQEIKWGESTVWMSDGDA